MKKPDLMLKEYSVRLSDDNLKFVNGRLSQRLSGDLPEVLDFMSNTTEMDRWLSSAKSSWDVYEMLDISQKCVEKEFVRRFGEGVQV